MAPKRTSSAGQAAPAKKPRTRAPEALILDYLGKCEDIPKPCREMLQAAVPICLEVVEADRHKFQAEVLGKVAELLNGTEGKKREAVSGHEAENAAIEAEKAAVATDFEAKKAASAAQKGQCDEKGKVVDAAREVGDGAQKVLTAAQEANASFETRKATLFAEKESFATLLAEVFGPLKEGTLQGNWQKRNKHVGELKKKLSELGAQDSLGEALAATLKMTPQKREGTFAKATMDFAEDYFNKHTAKVAQDIASLDAEAATLQAAITGAEGVLAVKKEALGVVEKDWDAMQDVWVKLEEESATAARTLKQIEARIPKVLKNIDKAKDALEKFMEIPALFAKLKEHSTAVPEEPEAPEEAVEAEAVEAAENAGDAEMQA